LLRCAAPSQSVRCGAHGAPRRARAGRRYVAGAVTAGAAAIVGAAELMQSEVPWRDVGRGLRAPRAAGVARGLALGLPFLLLSGVLFAAAAAVFENLLVSAVPSLPGAWWPDVLVVVGVAWTSAGLLRDLLANREDDRIISPRATSPRIGATEVAVALGGSTSSSSLSCSCSCASPSAAASSSSSVSD